MFQGRRKHSLPEVNRTSCQDRGSEAQRLPNHISKTVLPTVKMGPPDLTKSRTFTLRFQLVV